MVRELRQRASELLRQVERGEVFEITDRGRPVALLSPLPPASPLDRLRTSGEVAPANAAMDDLPPPLVIEPGQEPPSSVLAKLRLGPTARRRGTDVLRRIDLLRVSDRVLSSATKIRPATVRSLDAIHLATALQLGDDLACLVTYDHRMAAAAGSLGCNVIAPS